MSAPEQFPHVLVVGGPSFATVKAQDVVDELARQSLLDEKTYTLKPDTCITLGNCTDNWNKTVKREPFTNRFKNVKRRRK